MTSTSPITEAAGPLSDPSRLAAIHRTGLLNLPPDEAFERITRLAKSMIGVKFAGVALVTDTRVAFLSASGLAAPYEDVRETPVGGSLCYHVVMSGAEFATNDARLDAKLRDSTDVVDYGIVAYAGIPLRLSEGSVVGVLSVGHDSPHSWTDSEMATLGDLAAICVREIESRLPPDSRIRPPGRLVHLLELLPVGLYFCDANGRLVYYNRRASDLWGQRPALGNMEETAYSVRQLRTGSEATSTVDETPVRQVLARTLVPEREFVLGEGQDERRVIYTAGLIDAEDGTVTGAICIMHDVTLFRKATSLRDDLLALVSHEMRTPLTVIGGMAGFLSRETRTRPDDDPFRIAITDIIGSTRRMERVVENMLLLSRLEHESAVLEPVMADAAVKEAVGRHLRDFPSSNVEVVMPRERVAFEAVSSWVNLILVNLLGNAEQYGDHRRPHILEVSTTEGEVHFNLCNSGPALNEDAYATWFEPFYRAPETAVQVAGAGLGLTVAKRLAEAQEGNLVAEPWRDFEGTKVTLTLRSAQLGDGE